MGLQGPGGSEKSWVMRFCDYGARDTATRERVTCVVHARHVASPASDHGVVNKREWKLEDGACVTRIALEGQLQNERVLAEALKSADMVFHSTFFV
jgi:hypothetical protein